VSAQSVKRHLLAGALLLTLASCPLVERQATQLQPAAQSVAAAPKAQQLASVLGSGLLAAGHPNASPSAAPSAKPKPKRKHVISSVAAVSKEAPGSTVSLTSAQDLKAGTAALAALSFALDQLGKPYVWGAEGPDSYDCSGLTMRAYESAGYQLPRTAAEQSMVGTPVDVADLLPGDLLFYATDPSDLSTVHHVVMYAGAGLVVHAPHSGDVVRLGPMWLGPEYAGAVRVVDAAAALPVQVVAVKLRPKRPAAPRPSNVPVAYPTPSRPSAPPARPSSPGAPATTPVAAPPSPEATPSPAPESPTPESPTPTPAPTEVQPSVPTGVPTPSPSPAGAGPSVAG
jgi:cell wall-associated NlpC family hydrolase